MCIKALLCALAISLVSVTAVAHDDPLSSAAVDRGRVQYELAVQNSQQPRYGTCWTDALAALTAGCKDLDDDQQARMALNFANCFLASAGMDTHECTADRTVAQCLQGVSSNAFTAYTNFFTVSR